MVCLEHLKDGAAGAGQVWPECPRVEVAVLPLRRQLTPRGAQSCVSKVLIKELNDFGHKSPQITQQCLEVVRSPSMFVSPFCCS